jgi:hypothetical protein
MIATDALEKCMLAVLYLERFLMEARVEEWLGTQGVRQDSAVCVQNSENAPRTSMQIHRPYRFLLCESSWNRHSGTI